MYNMGFGTGVGAGFFAGSLLLFFIFMLWSIFWKAIALWLAARNNHKPWFIILMVINTAGILEIVYIFAVAMKRTGAKKNLIDEIDNCCNTCETKSEQKENNSKNEETEIK